MSRKASEGQEKVMSFMYKGKGIFKPMNTGWIDERAACLREYIANIFFYTKNGITIMIDAGYNYPRLREKMEWLGIDPADIHHILLTHQDTDHVGAVEEDSDGCFKHARLYLSKIENRYLTGETRRKVYFKVVTLPQVVIPNEKELLQDGQILYFGNDQDIKVECFLVPGHTWGHMVYLIDNEYLFTGDSLWLGYDGGYSFIHALAENNRLAVQSLKTLKEKLASNKNASSIKIITGHTGWTSSLEFAFAHTDQVCNAFCKQKPEDPKAPYDGYDESDDTRQKDFPVLLPA